MGKSVVLALIPLLGLVGCNSEYKKGSVKLAASESSLTSSGSQQASANLEVRALNDQVIYQEANRQTSLSLESGLQYRVCFTTPMAGVQADVRLQNALVASGSASQCHNLDLRGRNPGNYALQVSLSAPGALGQIKNYTVAITCQRTVVAGMRARDYVTGVSVSRSGAAANVYSYSAQGARNAEADCAFDYNGDGVVDSAFGACQTAVVDYSNHVGLRRLKLFVRERSCNYSMSDDYDVTLPWSVAATDIHIQALVASNVVAQGRERMLNLQHLSTNAAARRIVSCSYANGVFTVQGYNRYAIRQGQGSHGFSLAFTGLQGTSAAQNVAVTPATKLNQVKFETDFEVDAGNPITFTGDAASCQGTIRVTNLPVQGIPCASAPSGFVQQRTVLAEGNFGCSNLVGSDAYSSINVGGSRSAMTGTYYCMYNDVDACVGGGGGGGGIVPQPY